MSINEYVEEQSSKDEIIEEVLAYSSMWVGYDLEGAVSEDDEFVYLELEADKDIADEFQELGRELKARSTGVVNDGERYVLAVSK